MKKMVFAILCLVVLDLSAAEERPRSLVLIDPPRRPITGNLRIDLFGQTELADVPHFTPQQELTIHRHKSPYIAAGLSLVVPGTGQFYTERYWEAATFLGADVVAWVLAYHYDKRGDKQTDFFQNFADAHWSVVDYAQY